MKGQHEQQIRGLMQKIDHFGKWQKEDLDRSKREFQEAVMREYQQKFTVIRSEYQQKQTQFIDAIHSAEL
jgi:hypothetical protein